LRTLTYGHKKEGSIEEKGEIGDLGGLCGMSAIKNNKKGRIYANNNQKGWRGRLEKANGRWKVIKKRN